MITEKNARETESGIPHTRGFIAFLPWLIAGAASILYLVTINPSVSLLPHDRTHQQRLRETSDFSLLTIPLRWVPPVVAAIICGLQLTFWENATVASNDMLDLLVFAYIIRNILEYRIAENESWLFRAALVYGLALPSLWAMIA